MTWINILVIVQKGCVVEFDLEYPEDLQELHNDYPLAPEKIKVMQKMLSDCPLEIADLCNIPIGNI